MKTIRLIREVHEPTGRGPGNGQAALQKVLRAASIPWLIVGGHLQSGEIPWLWSWQDAGIAAMFAQWQWPFVIGPNMFFHRSDFPGSTRYEADLLDAESCSLVFTESEWYRDLIALNRNHNIAPIAIFSYPIDPQPDGPLPVEYDALIYSKDRKLGKELLLAEKAWPRHKTFVYGAYDREEMIEAARRSRLCIYLSSDDRGPLALAEILLAGCPAIGIERGSPWLINGVSGEIIGNWTQIPEAAERVLQIDRKTVREWAVDRFATDQQVSKIIEALKPIAEE